MILKYSNAGEGVRLVMVHIMQGTTEFFFLGKLVKFSQSSMAIMVS